MSNVKSVTITNNGVVKEYKSLRLAADYLGAATTTLADLAKYGQKCKGWSIQVRYFNGCIDCGTSINRLDQYCHPCYIKDLDYDPTKSDRCEIGTQIEVVQARII
jgi:hypothetical protein